MKKLLSGALAAICLSNTIPAMDNLTKKEQNIVRTG